MTEQNKLEEAKKLLSLIDLEKISDKKTYFFVISMKNKAKFNSEFTDGQIYSLRDIKDKQLDK